MAAAARRAAVRAFCLRTFTGAAVVAGSVGLYNTLRPDRDSPVLEGVTLHLDSRSPPPQNRRPSTLWVPPTRAEMIAALRAGRALPRDSAPEIAEASSSNEGGSDTDGSDHAYDLLIIGGGATGAGVALDAASRGLKVAMVDRADFSSGTSSKSTKLVHGGVRYLQKAVMELDYEQLRSAAPS